MATTTRKELAAIRAEFKELSSDQLREEEQRLQARRRELGRLRGRHREAGHARIDARVKAAEANVRQRLQAGLHKLAQTTGSVAPYPPDPAELAFDFALATNPKLAEWWHEEVDADPGWVLKNGQRHGSGSFAEGGEEIERELAEARSRCERISVELDIRVAEADAQTAQRKLTERVKTLIGGNHG